MFNFFTSLRIWVYYAGLESQTVVIAFQVYCVNISRQLFGNMTCMRTSSKCMSLLISL